MADPLKDQLKDIRDRLDEAIAHEQSRPANVGDSEEAARQAIDEDVNLIIILNDPPSLDPHAAGKTTQSLYFGDRLAFLQALRGLASEAYDETNNGYDHEVIGGHLWTVWNSRTALYALYP